MKYAVTKTRVAWVGLAIEDGAICGSTLAPTRDEALSWLAQAGADERASRDEAAPFVSLAKRAAAGEEVDVRGVVRLVGGTAFQRAVWEAIRSIPHGSTISYAELAQRVGRPGAARAVGQAVGANPIPLLIPCHRVVGAAGGLGGFGGGLPMKRTLLRQEGVAV